MYVYSPVFPFGHLTWNTLKETLGRKCFNFLPSNKILDWTKLEGFADRKLDVARVENTVGKGENAGYSKCSLPTVFSEGFFLKVGRSRDSLVTSYIGIFVHTISTNLLIM